MAMGTGVQWLVVGLGNPGDRYDNTRHNVGFGVCDLLAKRANTPITRLRCRALTAQAELGGKGVLLMKPMTYMNLSGEAVGAAARFYHIPPRQVLVVCDDTALPLGKLRIRREGSAGGHNGLKSLIAHLGGQDFPRLKFGVGGKPHPDYDMADWVLSKFPPGDRDTVDAATARAADAVVAILRDGVDEAMGRYN